MGSTIWKDVQNFPRPVCPPYFSHLLLGFLVLKIPLLELEISLKIPLALRERGTLD